MSACGSQDGERTASTVKQRQQAASQRYSDLPAGSWRKKFDEFSSKIPDCVKCQKQLAKISANQREPMCYECLHEQLLGKVRLNMKTKGMVQEGDKVLVALSGGPSSFVMLSLLNSLRNTNSERLQRGKVRFQIVPTHIKLPDRLLQRSQDHMQMMQQLLNTTNNILEGANYREEDMIIRLESLYDDDEVVGGQAEQKAEKLALLLQAVKETTGQEDLLVWLRMHLLLQTAKKLGCNRIARGDNASMLASKVIADTSKGRGTAIPDEINLIDNTRFDNTTLILPVREMSAKELTLLGRHLNIPSCEVQELRQSKGQSLNALSATFMSGLVANLPSSAYSVLRTAQKLESCLNTNDEIIQSRLCALCAAPIIGTEQVGWKLRCCRCCGNQIFNLDGMMGQTQPEEVLQYMPKVILNQLKETQQFDEIQTLIGNLSEKDTDTNVEQENERSTYGGWNRNYMKEEVLEFSYGSGN